MEIEVAYATLTGADQSRILISIPTDLAEPIKMGIIGPATDPNRQYAQIKLDGTNTRVLADTLKQAGRKRD